MVDRKPGKVHSRTFNNERGLIEVKSDGST
jgi:hypothetical protein